MAEIRSIGIDWSGIAGPGQCKTIFTAEVASGRLVRPPVNGRTRKEVVDLHKRAQMRRVTTRPARSARRVPCL